MDKNRGFIQLIVIFLLLVVILSLLGVSLSALFQNKTLQENFSFIGKALKAVLDSWVGKTIGVVWEFAKSFFVDFIWSAFIDAMNAIKAGQNPILKQ
ncbi:MAG: hypothetical protein A2931_03775 [Candidatus Niyogibacteria bacterium RIFCSPLOWO2_01_FULL_45_48]|uniref:Uncharacterized protein n=2 Tax=Candidatus Niyogiibacteriota TaxID=1817912 RepID=A0A1G2EYP1_9BACT|nr:MAG: hypothetical protein A2835_00505 [Candidatus Niyogibacteria bacterium RIFCSPHIGHO2_01_FULL_45_28]OGZ30632.1 MAG: hypothetical protein A3J00_00470 [Candidatus Niyogibacteria bacterium RIFCSPLOWO2_02_FULL_45_13]OGZ31493.1 MAG: hypothetical protein A2931_03775 [Candidatus Niyogibacteria bacterium RIFCSPLOWO2_01_FULL_45_48]